MLRSPRVIDINQLRLILPNKLKIGAERVSHHASTMAAATTTSPTIIEITKFRAHVFGDDYVR